MCLAFGGGWFRGLGVALSKSWSVIKAHAGRKRARRKIETYDHLLASRLPRSAKQANGLTDANLLFAELPR